MSKFFRQRWHPVGLPLPHLILLLGTATRVPASMCCRRPSFVSSRVSVMMATY